MPHSRRFFFQSNVHRIRTYWIIRVVYIHLVSNSSAGQAIRLPTLSPPPLPPLPLRHTVTTQRGVKTRDSFYIFLFIFGRRFVCCTCVYNYATCCTDVVLYIYSIVSYCIIRTAIYTYYCPWYLHAWRDFIQIACVLPTMLYRPTIQFNGLRVEYSD